ncbi:MAG: hypothetical protein ACXW04_06735 [Methylobacter sp.]
MDRKALLKEVNRLVSSGLRKSAIDIINEYLENTPNDPFVLRALGRVYLLEKKPDHAIKYLQLSLSSNQSVTALNNNSAPYGFDELGQDDLHYIENSSTADELDYSYASGEEFEYSSKPITSPRQDSNDLNIGLFGPEALDGQDEHNADNEIKEGFEQDDIEYTGVTIEAFAEDVDFPPPPKMGR